MFTHCPSCDTHFEITQEYIDIAQGKVRCGKCNTIFNALDNLYEKEQIEQEQNIATKSIDTKTVNSHEDLDIPHKNIINIKEKMGQITASLSAATQELKRANRTSAISIEKSTRHKNTKPSQQSNTPNHNINNKPHHIEP
ncbi:MAG: zinc-ribbon domain-containing protein, partial [Bacteroidales bacterium]|nr:zinc-ribbon domain-containing protein [Bacteroidales bacterium]